MRLKGITLDNFRSYSSGVRIPVEDLTVFVGRNDVGKSTVLEALEIFFNSDLVKMQGDDASKGSGSTVVRIGCVFDQLPDGVVLDADAPTALAAEYLVNSDGDLEVIKTWDCSKGKMDGPVYLRAVHPTVAPFDRLIQLTNAELKKLVGDHGLNSSCSLSDNPSMRRALYDSKPDLRLEERDLRIDDAKVIWDRLRKYLPEYGLFQADRPCKVDDAEIQDPMKLAVKEALAEIGEELERIESHVRQRTEDIATATVDKLRETHPDLAAELVPRFKPPTWNSVFKIDLDDEAGIPINKRGSGVRRLILLSFFRARAERARRLRAEESRVDTSLILGVEEPEAAQHPNSQRVILESFIELTGIGDQVIMTTHEPALAALLLRILCGLSPSHRVQAQLMSLGARTTCCSWSPTHWAYCPLRYPARSTIWPWLWSWKAPTTLMRFCRWLPSFVPLGSQASAESKSARKSSGSLEEEPNSNIG